MSLSFAMLFLIITFWIYDSIKKKKKARRDREEEENAIEIPNTRGQVVPLEVLSLDKRPNINEEILTERVLINNPSCMLLKKADSFGEVNVKDSPLPKPRRTLSNIVQIKYPTDTEGYRNDQSGFPINKDADTQTTMTLVVKKKEDLRKKGCWTTTLITVAVIYIYIYI